MNYFVDVVLPIPVNQLFTYEINKAEFSFIKKGMRVAVPFGKKKIYTSIVYSIHTDLPIGYDIKPIFQIIDEKPLVNDIQLKFWDWISKYYMCSIGDVMRASIPSVLLLEGETVISKSESNNVNEIDLDDEEFLIMQALDMQSSLKIDEISSILNKKNIFNHLESLSSKNLISINESLTSKYKPKFSRCLKLSDSFLDKTSINELKNNLKRSPKQLQVLNTFLSYSIDNDLIEIKDLKNISNASSAIIKKMIEKEIFLESYIQIDRIQTKINQDRKKIELNDNQTNAFNHIIDSFSKKKYCFI